MKNIFGAKYFLVFCLFLAAQSAYAGFPVLGTDPAVTTGSFPNGMTYYLVSNPSIKGLADVALVQKTGTGNGGEETLKFARGCLDSLPLFRDRKPMDFLISIGVRQPKSGYVKVSDKATVYRFRGLPLTGETSAVDSVFLLLFGMANMGAEKDSALYAPENQAIVISGDVDAAALSQKLYLLSLMLPYGQARQDTTQTRSAVRDTAFISEESLLHGLAAVKVSFRAGRLPKQYMNTILPLMSKHLWSMTAKIIRNRLEKEFRLSGIPVGKISFSTRNDGKYSGNDDYFVSAVVNSSDVPAARQVMMAVLDDLAAGGMDYGEFLSAERKTVIDMERLESATFLSNEIMVDKCISSFVYGTSIVSSKDESAFLLSSDVPDSVWIDLLNGFMKGLVEDIRDRDTEYELQGRPYTADSRDTVLFPVPSVRSKITKTVTSKVSDGPVWIFSNGMKVYYKNFPTGGDMYYSFVICGGYGDIEDLKNGEGAFYSDMFFTGSFCGVDGSSFRSILEENGISMRAEVGLADTKLKGRIRGGKFDLFMKSLLAAANGYEADTSAAMYHLDCEKVRLAERRGTYACRMASVDSIMCSGYNYSTIKNYYGIYDDLPERSADFFRSIFSESNDGALILVGDMEEYKLKRLLQQYLGGFRTENYPVMTPVLRYQPVSGWSTYTSDGQATTVDVVTSTPLSLNGKNYMAAKMASYFIHDALAASLSGSDAYYYVREKFSFAPQERFSLSISVERADKNGLPLTVEHVGFLRVLYAVRAAVSSFEEDDISEERLSAYKARLKADYDSDQSDPEYWLSVISERIAEGKTFNRFYNEAIDAVTAEDVKKVITAIGDGSKVEYIVRKR